MLARFVNSLPFGLSEQITKVYYQVLLRNQRGTHSNQQFINYNTMDIKVLPALQDNYMYLIIDKATKEAAVVDPVEPETVMKAVAETGVTLTSVLTTHHHWDHSGGNENLVKLCPNLKVYGGDMRIGALTDTVQHKTMLNIGKLNVLCLFTPCHTTGHMCYYVHTDDEKDARAVFTGDTLFLGGCGRFFEGDAKQMYTALINILGSLPDDTKVFCGHEYTLQNLKFAAFVEPENETTLTKTNSTIKKRELGKPSVPSTIGDEKLYNPFMRVEQPSIMKHASKQCAIETMAFIRQEKDYFKG